MPSQPEADDRHAGFKSQRWALHGKTAGNGDGGCCAGVEMRLHDTIPAYTFDSWGNYISQLPFKFACCSLLISLNRKPYRAMPFAHAEFDPLSLSSRAVVSSSNLKRSGRKEGRESLARSSLILQWSQAIPVRLNPLMVTRSRSRVRNACWHSATVPLTMVRRAMIRALHGDDFTPSDLPFENLNSRVIFLHLFYSFF